MPRVADNDPNARFLVTVWEAKEVSFANLDEARNEYARLKAGGHFAMGEVAEWVGGEEEWKILEEHSVYDDEE